MKEYFLELEKRFRNNYSLAKQAKEKGLDPSKDVEVLPANDLAERVENLIGIEGLANEIMSLERKGLEREKICLEITDSLINGELGDFSDKSKIAEAAVRSSVALLTEGIVAAPIEGISEVTIENEGEYLRISYSGPIRSAGGTAQVVSVLVGDYVRRKLGVGEFKATEDEIERYVEEIPLYKRIRNLQYTPSKEEINKVIGNCPVLVDGESTEDEEVSGQRNLERIKTNRVRGGMCLVVAEGLVLKAPKLQRLVNDLEIEGWTWLDKLIEKEKEDSSESNKEVKYLSDLIAGRPVFSHPNRSGGFRLRLGRSRNSGLATAGVNPSTMVVFDEFISSGTQIKLNKPGKAAGIVSVDSIDGPTVRLNNGDVIELDDLDKANRYKEEIDEIIDVGEMLINYGDFLENNHELIQPSFSEEWWIQLAKEKNTTPSVSTGKEAVLKSKKNNIPLHPDYTYCWHDLSTDEIKKIRNFVSEKGKYNKKLKLPKKNGPKNILEKLLIEHKTTQNEIILNENDSFAFLASLGLSKELEIIKESEANDPMEYVNEISEIEIMEKAPSRIGCRMGRPEKSKERKMSPPTHVLFPVGEAGGKERSIEKASSKQRVFVEVGERECSNCDEITYRYSCPSCGKHTELIKECPDCGIKSEDKCPNCGKETTATKEMEIDVSEDYKNSLSNLNERNNLYDRLKGVKGLTSRDKSPEPLEKGILRAKHDQYVFKDGTIRYDLTDLPLTHFKPKEINTTVQELKELGYESDIDGKDLVNENQVLELKVQDVILSKEAIEYLFNTSKFLDDLLTKYYGIEPHYEADTLNDLKGTLLVGLAPHTSAGVLSRLIGYTEKQANFAHPYFHAAKRRNCFHPGEKLFYKVKGEWKKRTIQNLVEKQIKDNKKIDDFGTKHSAPKEDIVVPSITKEGKLVLKELNRVQKTPSPDHLINFVTKTGKELKVTPDHRMLIYRDNEIKKISAHRVKEEDYFLEQKPNIFEKENKGINNSLNNLFEDIENNKERIKQKNKINNESTYGDTRIVPIKSKEIVKSETDVVYNIEVNETNSVNINGIYQYQCDGDEDCYMMLLDGLLNFSRSYLPNKTGGRMDAPLVLTYSLDPNEVDDEAHNLDIVKNYSLDLYEATKQNKSPKEVDVEIGEDRLGTDKEINDFKYSIETSDIGLGPKESAYKKLGSMIDKTNSQLELAKKTRAVDEEDVAEKVIEKHFLPDLMGNLRAFSTQRVRCVQCNSKYRRPPLNGKCTECGGDLTLTVHENSVKKYLSVSKEVAEKYNVSNYIKERLNILELSLESLFEDDQQTGLADFM